MTSTEYEHMTQHNIVAFLEDIFTRRGGEEYLGEPVTMAEHMLQGAALAAEKGYSELTIVSALLHDVGHFTSEFGMFTLEDEEDRFHEEAGARVLERFFPALVVDCVRHHVAAKRYLCATEPEYLAKLSQASLHSLSLQGGPMTPDEVREFETLPNLEDIVRVRYLDDAGKNAEAEVPDFSSYRAMIQRVVDQHACMT